MNDRPDKFCPKCKFNLELHGPKGECPQLKVSPRYTTPTGKKEGK